MSDLSTASLQEVRRALQFSESPTTSRQEPRLGVKLTKDPPASDGQLGDWFANYIDDPVPVVVCVNSASRIALLLRSFEADEMMGQFRFQLRELLDATGIVPAAADAEVAAAEQVVFAPTNDRRLLGSLNDICFNTRVMLEQSAGATTGRDLFGLVLLLARMPHVKQPDPFPESVVRTILGARGPQQARVPTPARDSGTESRTRFVISESERILILDHTLADPEVIRLAVVAGGSLVLQLTPDDLDDLIGHVAFEANHTTDRNLERLLDALCDRLQAEADKVDSEH